jgi:hypothetical protein
VGLALIRPVALRPALAAVLLANAGSALWVQARGINPSPVTRPGLPAPELAGTTPHAYGQMIAALEAGAADIRAHLETRSPRPQRPSIFLYTGGMGYFLPEFHVYETLVSYRHACPETITEQLHSAHYVQQFGSVPVNAAFEAMAARRTDLEAGTVAERWLTYEGPTYIRYAFGAAPRDMGLPARLHGPCRLPVIDPRFQPYLTADVRPSG